VGLPKGGKGPARPVVLHPVGELFVGVAPNPVGEYCMKLMTAGVKLVVVVIFTTFEGLFCGTPLTEKFAAAVLEITVPGGTAKANLLVANNKSVTA